jgi:hypothetical protein
MASPGSVRLPDASDAWDREHERLLLGLLARALEGVWHRRPGSPRDGLLGCWCRPAHDRDTGHSGECLAARLALQSATEYLSRAPYCARRPGEGSEPPSLPSVLGPAGEPQA